MQKLFSMFPRGAAGVALLLLRLFVGAELLLYAAMRPGPVSILAGGCALAIAVGIATPIAAALGAAVAVIETSGHWSALALHSYAPVVIASAVALLGPGAYSIDARVFGRRLIEFGPDVDQDE
jgi:hypothetical protein